MADSHATLWGMAGRYRGNGEGTISERKAIYAGSRSEVATLLALATAERDGRSPTTVEPSKLALSEYLAERLAAKRPPAVTSRRYALPDIQEIVAEAMEGYAF